MAVIVLKSRWDFILICLGVSKLSVRQLLYPEPNAPLSDSVNHNRFKLERLGFLPIIFRWKPSISVVTKLFQELQPWSTWWKEKKTATTIAHSTLDFFSFTFQPSLDLLGKVFHPNELKANGFLSCDTIMRRKPKTYQKRLFPSRDGNVKLLYFFTGCLWR